MIDDHALYVYTDGSCYASPRRGGMGIRFVYPESMHKAPSDFELDGYKGATNNQMELKVCIEALKLAASSNVLKHISRVIICTDSRYVVDNYKRAIFTWPKQKWGKNSGAPVLNVSLWKELVKNIVKVRKRVDIMWVKGHSQSEHNRAVDGLAKKSAKKATKRMPGFVSVRRKLSAKMVEVGSVNMLGQEIAIRIITCEWLRPQKIWKLKYEVMTSESPFYQNIDFIYYKGDKVLRDGHTYFVTFNDNKDFPQISQVHHEIEKEATPEHQ